MKRGKKIESKLQKRIADYQSTISRIRAANKSEKGYRAPGSRNYRKS